MEGAEGRVASTRTSNEFDMQGAGEYVHAVDTKLRFVTYSGLKPCKLRMVTASTCRQGKVHSEEPYRVLAHQMS